MSTRRDSSAGKRAHPDQSTADSSAGKVQDVLALCTNYSIILQRVKEEEVAFVDGVYLNEESLTQISRLFKVLQYCASDRSAAHALTDWLYLRRAHVQYS